MNRNIYFYQPKPYFPARKRTKIIETMRDLFPKDIVHHVSDPSEANLILFPDGMDREKIREELGHPQAVFVSDWWFVNNDLIRA